MAIRTGHEVRASWGTTADGVAANTVTDSIVLNDGITDVNAVMSALYNKLIAQGKKEVKVFAASIRYIDAVNQPD